MWYGSQGSGRKLKRGKFHLNVRKKPFRPEGGQALREPPERRWGLHQGRCSNPAGHGPAQPAQGIVLGLGAGADDPWGLRQPRLPADPGLCSWPTQARFVFLLPGFGTTALSNSFKLSSS